MCGNMMFVALPGSYVGNTVREYIVCITISHKTEYCREAEHVGSSAAALPTLHTTRIPTIVPIPDTIHSPTLLLPHTPRQPYHHWTSNTETLNTT